MRSVKALSLTAAAFGVALLSGCAIVRNETVGGSCYLDVTQPHRDSITTNAGASKVGKSMATSILGAVGTGDCSINAAAKVGGITKISYVDYHATSILGIFGTYTTIVYGE